jgi:hypothetical protein
MKPFDRNLLVLLKTESMSEKAIEQEVEKLHNIFRAFESPEFFCAVHELVDRDRITQKTSKLIRIYYDQQLKPFRFLISKN